MQKLDRFTGITILLLALLYFVSFIPPNSLGAQSEGMLAKTSIDEPVTYPYVVRMVTPPKSLKEAFERWVIYGDYHYGYPFYFWSALVVFPVTLVYGSTFTNHTPVNLLLLRQMVSVLPMVATIVLLVYLQTGFKKFWRSVGLFLVLASIPSVVRQNLQWWHPDALSVLFVVLTLFFLHHDNLQFGKNFLIAAAACGIAAGIKLAGVFFAPAIALYLLAGWRGKVLTLKLAVIKALLFLVVMLGALVISNPFLYNAGARQELVRIQSTKTTELDQGYTHDDAEYYQKGPQWWVWTLNAFYAHPIILGFLGLSLAAGCLWGPHKRLKRLVLAWIVPYSVYLLWFVAVKPTHYWLPVMLPLFAAALDLPDALPGVLEKVKRLAPPQRLLIQRGVSLLVILILVFQVTFSILRSFSGDAVRYQAAMQVEQKLNP